VPNYLFKNKDTGEQWEEFMGISAADKYLEENPHIERMVNGFPGMTSSAMGASKTKPDEGFRDVLREIKKNAQKGISRSTINTF
jgi:DNA-binding cell septation regulator SpoVG